MPRIVIVGAGVSGLSLAYRLRQHVPAAEVVVLEQRDRRFLEASLELR